MRRIEYRRKPERVEQRTFVTVTSSATHGGCIYPLSRVWIGIGLSKMFSVIPRRRYSISDVQVDGVSVGAVSTYIFRDLREDHTITASFERTEP